MSALTPSLTIDPKSPGLSNKTWKINKKIKDWEETQVFYYFQILKLFVEKP